MSKIIRVDMSSLKTSTEDPLPEYEFLGGRGLTARILNREVPPSCHPLSKYNKIIFAPGLMSGSRFPSSGRLSVGCKSPLTLGSKESNVGGTAGAALAKLGIKALIIEGEPADGKLRILKINKDGVEILPADNLAGLGNYETDRILIETYGKDVSVLSIGQVGERKGSMASVASTDTEGHPSRHAARGGPGAVMGAKGLKAIVIDDAGTKPFVAKNEEVFKKLIQEYVEFLNTNKGVSLVRSYGTMGGMVWLSDYNKSVTVNNFSSGKFEGASKIGGKKAVEYLTSLGSRWSVACMPGCLIRCSNIVQDQSGNHITSGLEYETVAMLGANLGIDDIQALAQMDHMGDDIGVDSIELGATLGLAMQAGLMKLGDAARAIELIDEIGKGTMMGRILGEGVTFAARYFGINRVPAIRGLAIPGHDPRVENVTGVTYCTSPQGADHTAGDVVFRASSPAEAVKISREDQIVCAICDNLGFCLGATKSVHYPIEKVTQVVNAQIGSNLSVEEMHQIGKTLMKDERKFNLDSGMGPASDRPPEFIRDEPLPPSNLAFDVSDSQLDTFWDF